MANLAPSEFENREFRFDIINTKVKNKTPFDMADNSSEVLDFKNKDIKDIFKDKDVKALKVLGGRTTMFKNSSNKEFKLSALEKTPEFGGGAGSGGGAGKTEKVESLQCYYLSLLLNSSRTSFKCDNCGVKDLSSKENLQYCHTDEFTTSKAVRELINDPKLLDWTTHGKKGDDLNVFMKIANKLAKHLKSKGFTGKYHIHRGSDFMKYIYESRKRAMDFDKKNDKKAPSTFSNDKWNPGDIWISTMDPNPQTSQPLLNDESGNEIKSFDILKQEVYRLYEEKKLLGISLKKVSDTANITEFNPGKDGKDRIHNQKVKIKSFSFGQGPEGTVDDFFSSIDVYINFDNGKTMQLRATDSTKSWQGEVKGAMAAQGKIGGGGLNYYTEMFLNKSIGSNTNKKGKWSETLAPNANQMYELYKKFATHPKNVKPIDKSELVSLPKFKKNIENYKGNSKSFLFSKNMCLLFLDTLPDSFSGKSFIDFSTQSLRYAMSNVDFSTYFIKVD